MRSGLPKERRFFVPEVVQTSETDCGPASLKAMLEGHGISASYGRLREACQTEVDGTSIDTIEEVAQQLGLEAEQVMLPADHLLLDQAKALPAIVVTRQPNGLTHFVVVWRRHGNWVQLMDPGSGRRWTTTRRFLDSLFVHRFPVPASGWREWAGSDGFLDPLRQRLLALGLQEGDAGRLIGSALEDPGWHRLAALDAATRLVSSIVDAGGIEPGREALGVVERFFRRECDAQQESGIVPLPFWSVEPLPADPEDEEQMLALKGAVLVRVSGRGRGAGDLGTMDGAQGAEPRSPVSPALAAVLGEPPDRPELAVLRALRQDGLLTPAVLLAALGAATFGTLAQALLLQGLLQVGQSLGLADHRFVILAALLLLVSLLFLVELPIAMTVFRIGRRLETRLRVVFLSKVPRLSDRYFHSRLTSDMTMRAYMLRNLHGLPALGAGIIRLIFQIVLTMAGLAWFTRDAAITAVIATGAFVALSFVANPLIQERDLRVVTHSSALSRFYLDALLGLIPLRTHGAERSFRREHEGLLVGWVRATFDQARVGLILQAVGAVVYAGFAVWLVAGFISRGGEPSSLLLLLYWTLSLPTLGQSLMLSVQQYPAVRNLVLRMLEPLGAPDESEEAGAVPVQDEASGSDAGANPASPARERFLATAYDGASPAGAAIEMLGLTVVAGGHEILKGVDLSVEAGSHLAIVGRSGAGKSTLVGLLLGWHRPAGGVLLVDGEPLVGPALRNLRRQTAWVDPAVQLWNRTLMENLVYGSQNGDGAATGEAIEYADLLDILERLPEGLQTVLGEGGGLVSGGEGQRVRLGRAMNRAGARLVILDEPFRGLDRDRRRLLLERARAYWREATLLCVTHDVAETQGFERVLVIEDGLIAEDGNPSALASDPASRYRSLLDAEAEVRSGLWQGAQWRRLWVENGRLEERN
ncbi:MAG: ATP-binding cassette domain-containing protein [Chloroflexi bacterium]|nr:ATP-binding cassette domain-containing protein [Chloroflexota bacterium]